MMFWIGIIVLVCAILNGTLCAYWINKAEDYEAELRRTRAHLAEIVKLLPGGNGE